MIDTKPQADPPPSWTRSADVPRWRSDSATPLRRFLGGSPLGVAFKLVIVSFVVGALLVWAHISPADVFTEALDVVNRLWLLGVRSMHDFGTYLLAGAVIVVPVWLVIRLLSFRGR